MKITLRKEKIVESVTTYVEINLPKEPLFFQKYNYMYVVGFLPNYSIDKKEILSYTFTLHSNEVKMNKILYMKDIDRIINSKLHLPDIETFIKKYLDSIIVECEGVYGEMFTSINIIDESEYYLYRDSKYKEMI